jgi:hypothetical protein
MVSCPVIVVLMLERRVVRCVHCDEDVTSNILVTVHISHHPTLQYHNYKQDRKP